MNLEDVEALVLRRRELLKIEKTASDERLLIEKSLAPILRDPKPVTVAAPVEAKVEATKTEAKKVEVKKVYNRLTGTQFLRHFRLNMLKVGQEFSSLELAEGDKYPNTKRVSPEYVGEQYARWESASLRAVCVSLCKVSRMDRGEMRDSLIAENKTPILEQISDHNFKAKFRVLRLPDDEEIKLYRWKIAEADKKIVDSTRPSNEVVYIQQTTAPVSLSVPDDVPTTVPQQTVTGWPIPPQPPKTPSNNGGGSFGEVLSQPSNGHNKIQN